MDATSGSRIRRHNTGIRARLVGVVVRGSGVVVDDVDRLDIHGEGDIGVIRLATRPLDRSLAVGRIASGPDTQLHDHGCLRVVPPAESVGILDCAHGGPVDVPGDGSGGPDDFVCVEFVLGGADRLPDGAVVGGRVAFAEIVGFDLGGVGSSGFLRQLVSSLILSRKRTHPINLVQIVRLHDDGADDPGTIGSFHNNLNFAKENIKVGLQRRRIEPLGNGEFGPVAAIGDIALDLDLRPFIGAALGEIGEHVPLVEACVGGTSCYSC